MQTEVLSKNFSETKFFSVLMQEMISPEKEVVELQKVASTPKLSTNNPQSLSVYKDVEYLKYLLSEVEQRRLYAIMCMTPDKIMKSSASSLSNVVAQLTTIADKIKDDIIYTEHKYPSNNKKKELTNEERARIEQLIKK